MKSISDSTSPIDDSIGGTLLYVTDLVNDSDDTLTSACELAEKNCAQLELVHVVDVERALSKPDGQMGIQYRLETLASRLRNLRKDVAFRLLFGFPEDVISNRAWEIKAKLVAFGMNGSFSPVQQRLIQRVMRRVRCPVVIIHPNAA